MTGTGDKGIRGNMAGKSGTQGKKRKKLHKEEHTWMN